MKASLTFFFLICALKVALANEFIAKVVKVLDGNTVEVLLPDSETRKIVLAGIDSPEPGQTFADKATRLLEKLVLSREVKVVIHGKTRKGDYLGVLTLIKNELDPRRELLEQGLAWTAEKDPHPELETIRMKAQQAGKGLWKESDPIPPWTYRREQSMAGPKSS